jgi:pilus assembly protein FimV
VITTLRNTRAAACALAWTLVLVLFAGPAFALGLGRIEVKSQRDEPLLAEIEIISSDPAELDRLQARLASPDTFARIGLEPPQGIVSNLQFTVALDARGRPVIRVTSDAPVQQPLLTFLVEVDWGQGRLVREYSALLDAPQTVSAPAQPPIQAPVAAPGNTVVRPAEAPVAPTPEPQAEAATAETETAAGVPAAAQAPEPEPVDTRVAPTPAPPAPAAAPTADEYGPVQAGDTLGGIAAGMRAEGETLDQAMVALFRANPGAFIAGNLNLMRQGVVLRMPQGAERTQYSAAEATALVREQIGQWREMRRPAPQPEAVAAASTDADAATTGPAAAPRVAGARLEIVPPGEGGSQQAGTRSGIDAGGEGDMLRQELQQKDEALAVRAAEVEELKARVADLEKLQAQQQQLISLKDSELAAAQQRLAETNDRPAATVAEAATGAPAADTAGTGTMLAWAGGALVLAAVLAWWLLRRRAARPAPRVFDTAALASGMPAAPSVPPAVPGPAPAPLVPPAPAPVPSWNAPTATATAAAAPPWHAGDDAPAPPAPPPPTAGDVDAPEAPDTGGPALADSGRERIELARAYVDLGDTETARGLLEEVAGSGDPMLRDEASRLLRELA